jgi:hypothetical protein
MIRRLCALVALGTLMSPVAIAASVEQTGRGEVTSERPFRRSELESARRSAIREAERAAVWKAIVGLVVDADLAHARDDIDAQVLPESSAFVVSTDVVDEVREKRRYEVVARVVLDRDALVRALEAIGIAPDDARKRHSIAVLVTEYVAADAPPAAAPLAREVHVRDAGASSSVQYGFAGAIEGHDREAVAVATARGAGAAAWSSDVEASATESLDASSDWHDFELAISEYFPPERLRQPVADPTSGAAIRAALLGRDVRVLDITAASNLQRTLTEGGATVVDTLADSARLGRDVSEFGLAYGADAVLVGVTAITYGGESGGVHRASAHLAARLVDAASGDVLASDTRTATAIGADANAAAASAAREVGQAVGQAMTEQVVTWWKRRDERGWEVTLRLSGPIDSSLSAWVQDELRGVRGVIDVEERLFDPGGRALELVLTTRDAPRTVRAALVDALAHASGGRTLVPGAAAGGVWSFEVR